VPDLLLLVYKGVTNLKVHVENCIKELLMQEQSFKNYTETI
jgi:hypothetical protein